MALPGARCVVRNVSNTLRPAVLAACTALLAWAAVTPVAADSAQRRLLIFAAPEAPALMTQRDLLAASSQDVRERDLAVSEVTGSGATAAADRKRYKVARDTFAVLLIGKDGGVKLRSTEPVPPDRLFATIDAMPMRQD